MAWREHLESAGPGLTRIRRHGAMRADAMLVAEKANLDAVGVDERSPEQLVATASLPGLVGEAWAMADWHFGYGFPIGGVVATDIDAGGVISPGGVGFDINCGVRLCALDLTWGDIPDPKRFARRLAGRIPSGPSGKGGVDLDATKMEAVLAEGAKAAAEFGWGEHRDLAAIESNGLLEGDERQLSERALARGTLALGTLGSGNHFLEVQSVDRVVDAEAAAAYGLREDQICVMIHTGSRGLGHQVCAEHVDALEKQYRSTDAGWYSEAWDITLPDRQLAAAPFYSKAGQAYFEAMQAAGNFAFANRSALTQRLRDALRAHLGNDADLEVVYDVSHNIAKIESHVVHGKSCNCCVHRKGATRALGGDHAELAARFDGVGQPVLVPGDMGTASWVLAGPKQGANRAFSSSCHGAGRKMSRSQARREIDADALANELAEMGILVHANTPNVLSEEAPNAYKDVDEVIELTSGAELARPVARMVPRMVIKG